MTPAPAAKQASEPLTSPQPLWAEHVVLAHAQSSVPLHDDGIGTQ